MTDEDWMQRAIELARENGDHPSDALLGAVIVSEDGKLLAEARNQTKQDCDATAHAEIIAIRQAGKAVGDMELRGATLYSTLQPCGMCSMAAIWAKVGRVVYGAGREDVHECYFEGPQADTIAFIEQAYRDDISIEGGVLRDECAKLYYRPSDVLPEKELANV